MSALLHALRESGELRAVDLHLARLAASLEGDADAPVAATVLMAAALASRAIGQGEVCATLAECLSRAEALDDSGLPDSVEGWRARLVQARALRAADGEMPLLVLDADGRVYLSRFYQLERFVAHALLQLAAAPPSGCDRGRAIKVLDALFPPGPHEPDWQRVAAAVALEQQFCVVSGGPGTGKTRTVARLLCLLQELAERPLRMALAAPTGKAAARLGQSIQRELPALRALLPEASEQVPDAAMTLHRLLGYRPGSGFRHGADNPLALDLLLVDEASMLDLGMVAKLLAALPPGARLILLGDRDQLSSVDAGNVFGDLCADLFDSASPALIASLADLAPSAGAHLKASSHPLADSICLLRHSFRFDAESALGRFAALTNAGREAQAVALLREGREDLRYLGEGARSFEAVSARLLAHFRQLHAQPGAALALQHLSQFQVLCALRVGPFGVSDLNRELERQLRAGGALGQGEYPAGRPLMVLQNDAVQAVFNGDVGLCWPDADGVMQVWFEDGQGGVRSILPSRLPLHESCYAMTIHKTQGSEFDEVCIVLPDQRNALLSRQLLYTGVTRARRRVGLSGPWPVIEHMIATSVQRRSGLRDALRNPDLNEENL